MYDTEELYLSTGERIGAFEYGLCWHQHTQKETDYARLDLTSDRNDVIDRQKKDDDV